MSKVAEINKKEGQKGTFWNINEKTCRKSQYYKEILCKNKVQFETKNRVTLPQLGMDWLSRK